MASESQTQQVIALLTRIAVGVEMLVGVRNGGAAAGPSSPKVDLDGKYGDPIVKAKSPNDWKGPDMTGRKFSQCPAEYLDLVAARLEFFAEREQDAKKASYNRLDAARARGWAERVRNGAVPVAPVAREADFDGDF